MARKTKDDTSSKIKKKVEEGVVEKPKRTRATKKKVEESKPIVIVNEPPKKRTRRKKEEEPKLASVPPTNVEPPKAKVQKVSERKKPKKSILKVKDFYEFEEGKYVLGGIDELFDDSLTKKMKTSIKKLSKKNHGKDDKLGIHYFKVGDKVWDLIEYNSKILTASNSLILCKDDIIKSGKLRFCRRFVAKNKFKVFADYTNDDYCLYFYYEDEPSPFIMLNDEGII